MSSPNLFAGSSPSLTCRPMIVDRGCPLIRYVKSHCIRSKCLSFRASSSGWLELLPAELKQHILMNLDLATLASLRLTNFEFNTLVNSIPAYQRMREHASTALRALQETETIHHYSLHQIEDALTSTKCTRCGDFGPFLFLLTCERTCFSCIYRDPELRLMRACDVQTYFAIQPRQIRKVRSMRSLPLKEWRPWHAISRKRWKMVLVSEAHAVALRFHGSEEAMMAQTDADYIRRRHGYDVLTQTHEIWGRGDKPSPTVPHNARELFNGRGNHPDEEFVWRWHYHQLDFYCGFGSVELPTFDVQKHQVQSGVWCMGCRNIFHWALGPVGPLPSFETQKILERNHFRAWNPENLLEHVAICKEEQNAWLPRVKGYLAFNPTPPRGPGIPRFGPPPPPIYPPHHGPRGRYIPSNRYRRRPQPHSPNPPSWARPPPPPPPRGWNYFPRIHVAIDPMFLISLQ